MPNRHKSFDEELAKKFDSLAFSQQYLLQLVNTENMNLEEALRETITSMGLRVFAQKSELSIQAVSDFVSGRQRWSTDKLIRKTQKVFQLESKIKLTISDEQ